MAVHPLLPYIMRLRTLAWGAVLVCSTSVYAGLFEDEEARRAILELRQSQTELRSQTDANRQMFQEELRKAGEENAQLRKALLETQNQMELLRSDLAKLRGQNELLGRDLADLQRRQKDDMQSTDDRLRKLEPAKVIVDGKEFSAEPTERRDYDAALGIFRKGDFERAQVALVDFLTRYGASSGYRVPALFWLGNAQYALKNYKEAVTNFRSLIAAAPDHVRAPEAMLAISNCQLEMKDSKAARKTLEELVKVFPASEAGMAAKERLARLK